MDIFIRPLANKKVRRPDTMLWLDPKGAKVQRDSYWIRRIQDKDVEIFTPALKVATSIITEETEITEGE